MEKRLKNNNSTPIINNNLIGRSVLQIVEFTLRLDKKINSVLSPNLNFYKSSIKQQTQAPPAVMNQNKVLGQVKQKIKSEELAVAYSDKGDCIVIH